MTPAQIAEAQNLAREWKRMQAAASVVTDKRTSAFGASRFSPRYR